MRRTLLWGAARPRAALRGQAGVSLVELLVTILVTSIVTTATVTLVIGVQRANARNEARLDQVGMVRTSVEQMARSLRSAVRPSQLLSNCGGCAGETAIVSASGYAVSFYADLDNPGNVTGPRRVSYSVATSGPTAGQLTQVVQRPDSAVPGASGYRYCTTEESDCAARRNTRVLATGVRTDGAVPLFTYFDPGGPIPAASSLAATQRDSVRAVEITLRVVGTDPGARDDTTSVQRVLLPNAQALFDRDGDGA